MAHGAATSYVMQSFMGAVNRMNLFNLGAAALAQRSLGLGMEDP